MLGLQFSTPRSEASLLATVLIIFFVTLLVTYVVFEPLRWSDSILEIFGWSIPVSVLIFWQASKFLRLARRYDTQSYTEELQVGAIFPVLLAIASSLAGQSIIAGANVLCDPSKPIDYILPITKKLEITYNATYNRGKGEPSWKFVVDNPVPSPSGKPEQDDAFAVFVPASVFYAGTVGKTKVRLQVKRGLFGIRWLKQYEVLSNEQQQ